MSFILIDAGNSRLKITIVKILESSDIDYDILSYDNLYEDLYEYLRDCMISQVVVSNVNSQVVFHIISDVIYKLWNIQPQLVVTQQSMYGISTRYSNPRTLGCDRWLAMIAARREFTANLCVIDCGTAVTIDVVSESGMHLGGLITPGINTARSSLALKTNQLPSVEKFSENINNESSFLAINTQDAILGGTLYQISAYIERIVSEIKQEFGENTEFIITGGDAEQLQALTFHQFHFRDALVLEGLRVVARDLIDRESL